MPEILLAHAINQFTILVGQTIAVFALMTIIFDVTCNGSLPLAFTLGMAQGLCGMCYGESWNNLQEALNYITVF